MANVVVSGYYGSKNAGDEAMLAAMIEVLSDVDPQMNITVISANPDDTKKRHGVKAIGWLDAFSIFGALRQADLLISGGGSLLQNVTSGRSLYYYLCVIALARAVGTPVMLYAQGIGPVRGSFARALLRYLADGVDYITVRDQGSLEELSAISVARPPMEVTADPVLAIHPVELDIGRKILYDHGISGVRPIVGIAARDLIGTAAREWIGWTHYKKVLAELTDFLAESLGADVVFLPMQVPEDIEAAKSIAQLAKAKNVAAILTEEYTTNELLSLVGMMDILIGVRLHALIFAGVMGVPMIGISYDPKIDRFLASIGEKAVGDLASTTLDGLKAAISAKWGSKGKISRQRDDLIGQLRRLAIKNAEEAAGLIEKRKK